MAGLIFLMLPISVLLVSIVAVIAFLDAAFREPRLATVSASQTATASLRELLETLEAVSGGDRMKLTREVACSCPSFVPMVTQPEAMAIAEELKQREKNEFDRVISRSRQSGHSCPMLTQTGLCACAMTRPLECIGRCVVGGDSPEWASGLGSTFSTAFRRHLEERHENSQTYRLDEALVSLADQSRV